MKSIKQISVAVKRIKVSERWAEYKTIGSSVDISALARELIGDSEQEHVLCFYVDARIKITGYSLIALGTIDGAPLGVREVFRAAIIHGATSIILAHNHPTDCTDPSPDDIATTRRVSEAGTLLGIKLLDHVIVGQTARHYSFRNAGILPSL